MNIKDTMWDAGKIVIVIYTFKWTYYCSKECHVIKGAFFWDYSRMRIHEIHGTVTVFFWDLF